MRRHPKAAIQINFVVSDLIFDARAVRTAIERAEARGAISTEAAEQLIEGFSESALHLATRYYPMRTAVQELKDSLRGIYELVQYACIPPAERIFQGPEWDRTRDRALVAVDSFLFEFRSYLELLARFAYDVLVAIGKGPPPVAKLSSGQRIDIVTGKKRVLKAHNFLRYLCDSLDFPTEWYDFLASHRNFFTHEGAPYCAIEDRVTFWPSTTS